MVGRAADRKPGVRRVRTHRSSDVNRNEELLLALVFFPWRGIHTRSLGSREISAQLPASTVVGARRIKPEVECTLLAPYARELGIDGVVSRLLPFPQSNGNNEQKTCEAQAHALHQRIENEDENETGGYVVDCGSHTGLGSRSRNVEPTMPLTKEEP